ncbi:TrbG/VirB9 family P-type conjugative transfer protein [Phenylobacterium sp. LjRoot225]|uniref:TrbG/VirB9 family P-type conjugative transfer protein n=1 Tax=Phenylobacterium sp. LjRoot225 TaxID=3342285 RepID=UPI003ECFEDF1
MKRLGILLVLAALVAGPASAQPRPQAAGLDRRVQLVDFDPDKVTPIRAALGYQLMIEFAPDERIENVSIGDSLGWQVTPNRRANIVFLKPIDGTATNMTVVTDARRYLFDLRLAAKGAKASPAYTVRFLYPAPATAAVIPQREPEPRVANAAYTVTGSPENAPSRIFDDGEMTYFEWPPQSAAPAIFAVAGDGSESMVNYAVRGPYVVVQQLAPRFVLRNGKQVATVVNGGYPTQQTAQR